MINNKFKKYKDLIEIIIRINNKIYELRINTNK